MSPTLAPTCPGCGLRSIDLATSRCTGCSATKGVNGFRHEAVFDFDSPPAAAPPSVFGARYGFGYLDGECFVYDASAALPLRERPPCDASAAIGIRNSGLSLRTDGSSATDASTPSSSLSSSTLPMRGGRRRTKSGQGSLF